MFEPEIHGITGLVTSILNAPRQGQRRVVAIVGPPGSGKSTIAKALVPLIAQAGGLAQVVPMDGFHLDNSILLERNLIDVKGSPGTFDVGGFAKLISRLSNEPEIIFPKFDSFFENSFSFDSSPSLKRIFSSIIIEPFGILFTSERVFSFIIFLLNKTSLFNNEANFFEIGSKDIP